MPGLKNYVEKIITASIENYLAKDPNNYNKSVDKILNDIDDTEVVIIKKVGEEVQNVNLSLKQAAANYRLKLKKFQNQFDSTFNIEGNKENNHYSYNNQDIPLIISPKKAEKERQNISDVMFDKIYDSLKTTKLNIGLGAKKFKDLGVNSPGKQRNFSAIFITNHKFKTEENDLKPENLLTYLKGNASVEDKQTKFHSYMQLLVKDLQENCIDYKNDLEFANNYSKMSLANWPFSVDNLNEVTSVFNFEPSEETKDLYSKIRPFSQTITNAIDNRAEIIADQSYAKYGKENLEKFNEIFEKDEMAYEEYDGVVISPFKYARDAKINMDVTSLEGTGYFYSNLFGLNGETSFVGKEGKINLGAAIAKLERKERVEVIKDDKHFTLTFGENGMLKETKDIVPPYSEDNREIYKDNFKACLKKLNDNTSIFNISSPEYKKLRTAFKDLAEHNYSKEQMTAKLREIKNISNLYKENHYKKAKISDIAYKRKESVDFVSSIANEMIDSLQIDSDLVNEEIHYQETKMRNKQANRVNLQMPKNIGEHSLENNKNIVNEYDKEHEKGLNEIINDPNQLNL